VTCLSQALDHTQKLLGWRNIFKKWRRNYPGLGEKRRTHDQPVSRRHVMHDLGQIWKNGKKEGYVTLRRQFIFWPKYE